MYFPYRNHIIIINVCFHKKKGKQGPIGLTGDKGDQGIVGPVGEKGYYHLF